MRWLAVIAVLAACSNSTAPQDVPHIGAYCAKAGASATYDASIKGWHVSLASNTRTYVTDSNGKRVEVRGCEEKGCIKLDPNKTLTEAQAIASCSA